MDTDNEHDVALKWKASTPPILVLASGDGKEFSRIVGYQPPDTLIYRLKEIARGYGLLAKGVELVKKNPEDPEGNYGIGAGLRVQNKFWDAKNYLEKALQNIKDKKAQRDLTIKIHYELAKTYFYIRHGQKKMAFHSKAVVDLDPKNDQGYTDEMYVTLSVGYYLIGRRDQRVKSSKMYQLAFDTATEVIKLFPKSQYLGQAYHFKGVYAIWLKKKELAIQIWKEGVKLFPNDPWSKRSEAFLLRVEKKKEEKGEGEE